LVLAGKLVFISGRLLVAGMFVFMTGTLLMADILVVPPIVLLAPLILELVAEVSVELLGVLWLQPTSAHVAKPVIADSVIIDFISSLFHFFCRQLVFVASPRQPGVRRQGRDHATGPYFLMAVT
jgi:hypothetical protein